MEKLLKTSDFLQKNKNIRISLILAYGFNRLSIQFFPFSSFIPQLMMSKQHVYMSFFEIKKLPAKTRVIKIQKKSVHAKPLIHKRFLIGLVAFAVLFGPHD